MRKVYGTYSIYLWVCECLHGDRCRMKCWIQCVGRYWPSSIPADWSVDTTCGHGMGA